jgi:hypothetical protein
MRKLMTSNLLKSREILKLIKSKETVQRRTVRKDSKKQARGTLRGAGDEVKAILFSHQIQRFDRCDFIMIPSLADRCALARSNSCHSRALPAEVRNAQTQIP